jgi:hypothetical protein
MTRAPQAFAMLTALALSGCGGYFSMAGTARPAHLSEWTTCILDAHELVESPMKMDLDKNAVVPRSGRRDHAVFLAHATWGKSALRTEHAWGELLVALTLPLRAGESQIVSAESASVFSVGSQLARRRKLHGRVVPLKIDADVVTLQLDLETDGAPGEVERFREEVTSRVFPRDKDYCRE